jgi:hypothetical protein
LTAPRGSLDIYVNIIKHTMVAVDHEQDADISMRLIDRLKLASQQYYKANQHDPTDSLAEKMTKDMQENTRTWFVTSISVIRTRLTFDTGFLASCTCALFTIFLDHALQHKSRPQPTCSSCSVRVSPQGFFKIRLTYCNI